MGSSTRHPIDILIVEDNVQQQIILSEILRNFEFVRNVDVAATGREMIQKTVANPDISALLLDMKLSGEMNGLEAYMLLKQRGCDLPAILITGYIEDVSRAYDLNIIDVVEKPYTPSRIEQAIKKLYNHIDYLDHVENGGIQIPIYNSDIQMLRPKEVLFFETIKGLRTLKVHTTTSVMETKLPIGFYEKLLEKSGFFPTHRSFLVNLHKVHFFEGNNIHFRETTKTVPVSDDRLIDIQGIWRKISSPYFAF